MIISVSVLVGFKKEIRGKVIGFGSHFQLVNYDSNYSFETIPVEIDSVIIKKSASVPHVKHIQLFATKPGLIKTELTTRSKFKFDRLITEGLIPQKRWGTPEDVAKAVASLARGDWSFSAGTVFEVSGGMNIHSI